MLSTHLAVSRWVSFTGDALWMPERKTADERFGFGLSAFGLGACWNILAQGAIDLGACGSLWGGALHAVVYQLTPTRPGDHFLGCSVAVAALASRPHPAPRRQDRSRFLAFAEVGFHLFVPLARQPFLVSGEEAPAFQESPRAILPFVGLGAKLP